MQVVTKNHLADFTEKLLSNDKKIRDDVLQITEEVKKSSKMLYDITNIMSLYPSYSMEYTHTGSSNSRIFNCVDPSNPIPFEPGKYVIYYSGSTAEGNNSVGGTLRAGVRTTSANYTSTECVSFPMTGVGVGEHIEIYDTFEVKTTKSLYPVMFVYGAGATEQTFHIIFDKIYIVNITDMELNDCIEVIRKNTMLDKIECSVVKAIEDVSANLTEKIDDFNSKINVAGDGSKFLSDDGTYKEVTIAEGGNVIQGPKGDKAHYTY